MHLAAIDQMANNGNSFFHRAQTVSKIIMAILLLTGVIITNEVFKLGLIITTIIMGFVLSRGNLKEIFHLALYPIFFSLLFALVRFQVSWAAGVIVILKSLGAALTMLMLVSTTPYTEVFSFFSLFMPALLIDIFMFTYRALFILLDKLEKVLRSIKLKGGYHPFRILMNLRNIAGILGVIIINSFDMSDRMFRIFSLRGYNGKIPIVRERIHVKLDDAIVIVFSILLLIGVVIPWNISLK